ncbi:hypothetical protein BT93_L1068 [Corymbia citriodora subsp. variegata]|uniref:Cysteine-rich receptor-like protein kinase 10 n=1 Tax=Corymbia citriodora subsp. variegata TaxID=360336 RepID=A0A8T0CTG0_CORYI|nr:hypothetical protein BT93_L1068 [Corymbia citriodora subsp. variegata]
MNSCFTISLSLSFFFIKIFSAEAVPSHLDYYCPNTTLFTPNSTYQSNLHALLSSLSSAATNSTDGFANTTAGQNPHDWAYGLFLCQGDLDTTSCSDCVATGKQDILELCPNQRVSIIWYDQCMLRYSSRSIFSTMERAPYSVLSNDENVTNPTLFMQLLEETLNDVATRASAGGPRKKYGIANLVPEKQGGRVLTPSCNVRYEFYPFFNGSALATPVSPPPAPAPATGPKGVSGITKAESLQYDLATIQVATNNFSHQNKLGEGGFGEVFQGKLPNGQKIAVKRLSTSSGQGIGEFKNEVVLVEKLQHRNLVQLLGFCVEGEEKILVYEFVPNKSLDYFLFDPDKIRQLDWSRRFKIISGIARGMLYLHEDSRFRIIHRDLKPSNVLLDSDMNPKISDFGMARIFGVDQTRANTNKIVGTFGYLSPEYAINGQISAKSDVYSFGVMILEIISGKRNSCFFQSDGGENLASYVWKHWRAGTPLEALDLFIGNSYSMDEVLRCLHIGLLGTQKDPATRPTMASIVNMLSSHSVDLPQPQKPAFFLQRSTERQLKELESDESTSRSMPRSTNEMSITEPYPR